VSVEVFEEAEDEVAELDVEDDFLPVSLSQIDILRKLWVWTT
jgi:hypothetical protein